MNYGAFQGGGRDGPPPRDELMEIRRKLAKGIKEAETLFDSDSEEFSTVKTGLKYIEEMIRALCPDVFEAI